MGIEIERRFLVVGTPWHAAGRGSTIVQGYVHNSPGRIVRVRIQDTQGFLAVKVQREGIIRDEFEYEIPAGDAAALLDLATEGHHIQKTRYSLVVAGQPWVIDVFEGENAGLVMSEAELATEDSPLALPPWVGREVTDDSRYLNAELARKPFTHWA